MKYGHQGDRWRSDDGSLIFCRWFRHWRTGQKVYRKDGGVFCFRAKRK